MFIVPRGTLCSGDFFHPDPSILMSRALTSHACVYSPTPQRSAFSQGPAVELWAGLEVTPEGLVSDADVLKVWLEVKMTPLLSSVSRQFLRCLANRNLSCEAYQTVYVYALK